MGFISIAFGKHKDIDIPFTATKLIIDGITANDANSIVQSITLHCNEKSATFRKLDSTPETRQEFYFDGNIFSSKTFELARSIQPHIIRFSFDVEFIGESSKEEQTKWGMGGEVRISYSFYPDEF